MADEDDSALSSLMLRLGYDVTASISIVKSLFSFLKISTQNATTKVTSKAIANVMMMMMKTHSNLESSVPLSFINVPEKDVQQLQNQTTWNVPIFVQVVNEVNPNLSWEQVIIFLDDDSLVVSDFKSFEIMIQMYKEGKKSLNNFPVDDLFTPWNNRYGQITLLREVIKAPLETFNLNSFPSLVKVFQDDDFSGAGGVKIPSTIAHPHAWNCRPLLKCLMDMLCIKESDHVAKVAEITSEARSLIDLAAKQAPETLLIGLVQLENAPPICLEIISRMLYGFIVGHPSAGFILNKVWHMKSSLFLQIMVDIYTKDATFLSRILDIAQELKALPEMLSIKHFAFAIDLASLASRREYLNLEKWLQDKIRDHGEEFVNSAVEFLCNKIPSQMGRQDTIGGGIQSVPLSVEAIAIFIKVLQQSESLLNRRSEELLREICTMCIQAWPRLLHLLPSMASSTEKDASSVKEQSTFPKDVEEEANYFYERIYSSQLTVDKVVDMLKKYKVSTVAREQQVYSCMLQSLFDEYHFFHRYPDKELSITSTLFGKLVQEDVLATNIALGTALRYVLEAIRSPRDGKMFKFGIQALNQFKSRLREWPHYCGHLSQIDYLNDESSELYNLVKDITSKMQGQKGDVDFDSMGVPQVDIPVQEIRDSHPAEKQVVLTSLNIDTLLLEKVNFESPPEAIKDKISFIMNNLSMSNCEEKAPVLKELLKPAFIRWFANYITVKRVSIEPNYHTLYRQFLDILNIPDFHRHLIEQSLRTIGLLLVSEKALSQASERSLLKNLGSWLGSLTLAINKPIRHKDLAVKDLLIECFESHRLIVAIPFVCKLLEQCSQSKVFKPPNPWLMAIVRLLVELYNLNDLKLNLKFEIELFLKNINLNLSEIEPSTILRERKNSERLKASESGLTGILSENRSLTPHLDTTLATTKKYTDTVGKSGDSSATPRPFSPTRGYSDRTGTFADLNFSNIAGYLSFNPSITLFSQHPGLKRLVLIAIDKSIRETIASIVERTTTVAVVTTRDLIVKDFAMEPNEEKFRAAALLTARNLSGALTSVTCKEPLRNNMMQNLKTMCLQNGLNEQVISEKVLLLIIAENMDLAVNLVEKVAMDRSSDQIDDVLATGHQNRKRYRERGQAYYDISTFQSLRQSPFSPDILKMKPGGLQSLQLRVYEDFTRVPCNVTEALSFYAVQVDERNLPRVSLQRAAETFLPELDRLIQTHSSQTLSSISPRHEIKVLMKQIPMLASSTPQLIDDSALFFCQKVVNLLFKAESQLGLEVYVTLLSKLCELSKRVHKEVTTWLLYSNHDRKFNVPVTVALIKGLLINVSECDLQLARLIESGKSLVVDFTAQLIRKCVVEEQIASPNDFINSIEMLSRLVQVGKSTDSISSLIEDLRNKNFSSHPNQKDAETNALREQLIGIFADWIHICSHPNYNEKMANAYINQLQQQGVLVDEEISSLFFRCAFEASVENYLKARSTSAISLTFANQAIDGYAKLVIQLLIFYNDPNGEDLNMSRLQILTKILSIIVLILGHAHEQQRQTFNQKPFFRFFTSFLCELAMNEEALKPIHFRILVSLSNTLHTLQPYFLPGFAFAWITLISNRLYMPKLLNSEQEKGWPYILRLLIDLFKFLSPLIGNAKMRETSRLLYKGTLRILLVLLHDFPEFLSLYHFSLCDVIPPSCIQLRNLVLTAFPRNMQLPDPFTPDLKVDLLPETNLHPRILSDYTASLVLNGFKDEIDSYLKTRGPVSFLLDLRSKLLLPANQLVEYSTCRYDMNLINALVLYVGIQAIADSQSEPQQGFTPITHSPQMDIFQQLLIDLDTEGRYLFLTAIANQLRYPNSHTHYFSCVLLYLFAEATQDVIKEQITRVLLERLIVNRPHPWGLLVTFLELIKNPRFNFWNYDFVRCSPEIENVFESVARSITQVNPEAYASR